MTVIRSHNGLPVDVAKADAARLAAALRYAERRRAAALLQSRDGSRVTIRREPVKPVTSKPRKQGGDWTEQTRALARLRSGGVCELCQTAPADHLHHRQPRRNRDHRIVNALHVCFHCHGQIHGEPARSVKCGWIVHSRADAASVPVVLVGRLLLLTETGDYLDVKDAA